MYDSPHPGSGQQHLAACSNVSQSVGTIAVSWHGYIGGTTDALVLFEACLRGCIPWVTARPGEGSRPSLARNGNIFIYNQSSGMVRWTDGLNWSPSRVAGNFLLYRELERQPELVFSGKKDRQQRKRQYVGRQHQPGGNQGGSNSSRPSPPEVSASEDSDTERQLYGPLQEGYVFKVPGLMKKTISLNVGQGRYHLISYYKAGDDGADAVRQLCRPSCSNMLRHLQPRDELFHGLRVRAQLQDEPRDVLLDEHVRQVHQEPVVQQPGPIYGEFPSHQYFPAQGPQVSAAIHSPIGFPPTNGIISQQEQYYQPNQANGLSFSEMHWSGGHDFAQSPHMASAYTYPDASNVLPLNSSTNVMRSHIPTQDFDLSSYPAPLGTGTWQHPDTSQHTQTSRMGRPQQLYWHARRQEQGLPDEERDNEGRWQRRHPAQGDPT